jgi:uncharacterized protein (DUF2384 family)
MSYFWWNICKERNRTSQHSSMEVAKVASVVTNNINLYQNVGTTEDLRTTCPCA